MQPFIFKDARYFQILFQTIFLTYGIFFLHWHADWWLYASYFGFSIITQFVCELFIPKKSTARILIFERFKFGFPSILISSFGLSLLLKTNYWYIAMLAAVVSIVSKYIISNKGKHIFNPSALGIVVSILFTGQAWFSPGQWGSSTVILFGVICLGFIVVTRVQKLDVSLAFLITYAGLLFFRQVVYLQWPIDFFIQSLSTGSLLIFSFFMITDPKTTPNHPAARILWAVLIAAVSFYLSTFRFMNGTAIWVLVFSQPLIPLLDKIFKGNYFDWKASAQPVIFKEQAKELVTKRPKHVHSINQ
jgi:Na+-transporting NADH:ubiquinone oxidoreductase subunit NqrB